MWNADYRHYYLTMRSWHRDLIMECMCAPMHCDIMCAGTMIIKVAKEHQHKRCRYYECWKHMQYVTMFCVQVLPADERVLVVQAVQTTHLRHHPCQIGAAVFSWQKTERLLLLWHQPTKRVDCIVVHSMTRSNSPDGSHHHITTPITSMDKLHRFPHFNTKTHRPP